MPEPNPASSDDFRCNCSSCRQEREYPPLPALENVYLMNVPSRPRRPVRLCSIEQEVISGGQRAARLMGENGLSRLFTRVEFSLDCRRGEVIVKEDGSLPNEGGEIVYSRFRLNSSTDVENLSKGLARIRQLKDKGLLATGRSAGTHIHISAQAENGDTFMPQHMASLHELFCHLEDMLYALAACGWDEHRMSRYGDGYCKVLPKVLDSTPAKVSRAMRVDRYLGLNFQRLFESVSQCSCGASLVGDWAACDCGCMESATIEWRLFNSATKPETIHAWLLVAHTLTAYAAEHELGTLAPILARTGSPATRWEQLNWMLDVCPFTESERKVIRDAAKRSPGFGEVSDNY